jgi:hypothetical protein
MSPSVLEIVLAGLNVDRELRDAITGDLIEERARLAEMHGARRADRWLRRQTLQSVPLFVHAAVWNGGVRRLAAIVGAAVAALLAIGLVIGASTALLVALVSPDTIARLTLVVFALDLAFGTAGGYLAARFGRVAPLGAAFVFGLLVLAIALMVSGGDIWYRTALRVLLVPATLAGGWLHARHLARSA